MLIDWFTVGAQIINFLILVFLLKRFLYGPIIRAMDERENRIAAQLADAEQTKIEAREEAEAYHRKNQEFEARREQMIAQLREDVEAQRKELAQKARAEVEEMRARWYEAIRQEQSAFLRDLRQRATQQTYEVVRQALRDLANADLERQMIDVFLHRLASLSEEEKKALAESVRDSGRGVVISSAFKIPKSERERIEHAVHGFANGATAQFETAPELISGIQLKAHGRKIAWTLEDYLESLEEHVIEMLGARS